MSFCIFCGFRLAEGMRYCPKCGNLVYDKTKNNGVNISQQPKYLNTATQKSEPPVPSSKGAPMPHPQMNTSRPVSMQGTAPAIQLATNRGVAKYFFLSLITFGIYGIVLMSKVSRDINIIAARYDGLKTMHYCLVYFLFSWLTFGILPLVWYTKLSGRIGRELERRGINYGFGAGTYWGWGVFGVLLFGVGFFIYHYKLFKSMNLLSEDFNIRK